jgi:hypothetical protein
MLRRALLLAMLVACSSRQATPREEWEPRSGPGFEVVAPYPVVVGARPMVPGVEMQTYGYDGGRSPWLDVTVLPLPAYHTAPEAIQLLRARVASSAHITSEVDLALGDTAGKDIRFTATHPKFGDVVARIRLVVRKDRVYQIIAMWPPSVKPSGTDRFVESFRFTEASTDN